MMKLILTLSLALFFASCASMKKNNAQAIYKKSIPATFEVVIDWQKPFKSKNMKFDKPVSFDHLPPAVRNNRYSAIGTAFFTGEYFVSASHVIDLHNRMFDSTKYKLRDAMGNIYDIDQVYRYSDYHDLIFFKLKQKPRNLAALKFTGNLTIGEPVYTVGSAQGEGIVVRDGILTSMTPEPEFAKFNFIRFTAPASPGNSGGPLLNAKGEVIGIVLRKNESENLNYALPLKAINQVKTGQAILYQQAVAIKIKEKNYKKKLLKKFKLPLSPSQLNEKLVSYQEKFYFKSMNEFMIKNPQQYSLKSQGAQLELTNLPSFNYNLNYYRNKEGEWEGYTSELSQVEDIHDDSKIYFSKYKKLTDPIYFRYARGKDARLSLAKLIQNPKIITEQFLKSQKFKLKLNDEEFYVQKLGKFSHLGKFKDDLNRIWISSTFPIPQLNMVLNSVCLPVPEGMFCEANFTSKGAESYSRFMQKIIVNSMIVKYSGSLKQWQEFQRLSNYRPQELSPQRLKIQQARNKIVVQSPQFQSVFDKVKYNQDSSVQITYKPTRSGLEFVNFLFTPDAQRDEQVFIVNKVNKPHSQQKDYRDNVRTYKDQYTNKKNHRGNYSVNDNVLTGVKVHKPKRGRSVASDKLPSHYFMSVCAHSLNRVSKEEAKNQCHVYTKSFRAN